MGDESNPLEEWGGTGAPENEAPGSEEREGNGRDRNRTEPQAAPAWTSQLPKELREGEAFKRVSGFKTVGELAAAYAEAAGNPDVPKEGESYGLEGELDQGMEGYLDHAREAGLSREQARRMARGYQTLMRDATAARIKATDEGFRAIAPKLTDEFGAEAAQWFRKAAVQTGLSKQLRETGLGANSDIARALVLLGREMSEDSTLGGGAAGAAKRPTTLAEGARLF